MDPQQVIQTYRDAAIANRATPNRQGCVIHVGHPSVDVVVGADLHGHRLNYQRILNATALEENPNRHLVLQEVCHGGPLYPGTQACMSHLLLEDVARLKVQWPDRVHFLLSNHELAELIELAIVKGKKMLNLQFRFGFEQQYGSVGEEVREAACEFIRTCPLAVRMDNRVWISHSAPPDIAEQGFDASVFTRELRDDDIARGGPAFQLVWGRDFRQENADAFAELVDADVLVHGHEPCRTGFTTPNTRQIILDSSKAPGCCLRIPLNAPATVDRLLDGISFL